MARLHLFEATGVELEYMIVDRETLDVRPIADRVLEAVGGSGEVEVELGPVAWSNELALHVIEIKTNGPVADLRGLPELFQDSIERIDAILEPLGARLMPGAMHPWMDPVAEVRLWPHEAGPIYRAFDRIFDCRGHGWANLQSTHVNLPFADDEEFGALHAAIRMLLPLLPAIAASSPVADGALTGMMDTRMEVYRKNARRVPSVSGRIVPERVYTRERYETELLGRIYDDLAPLDPEGLLRHEWVNARGAIARFDRGAIEIRVIDVQEAPVADVAIVALVRAVLEAMIGGRLGDAEAHRGWPEDRLGDLFVAALRDGERTSIGDAEYLRALGCDLPAPAEAGEIWAWLAGNVLDDTQLDASRGALDLLLSRGTLSRRLTRRLGPTPERRQLHAIWEELCDCLHDGRMFDGGPRHG